MAVFTQSDPFTHKEGIDLLQSFKNNVKEDEPTIWLFSDTHADANTIRASYCRYRHLGLLPKELTLKIVEVKKPAGVMIYRK